MSWPLIIFLIILFILTLGGTLYVVFQEDKKIKKYEQEGDSPEAQLQRSKDYETSSLKSNIPILGIIYGVTFLLAIVAIVIYIKFR
ncbi:hypothetical protein KO561_01445 [Radiobacillus kanasensis]|uniref:hypothetical protein n=1 Tax=Radiobacillus kanasensis TaxID=2844358 RepID=UPI001E4AD06B|nr:hypothetical protein [Radiobacillus kanasensis]UFT99669.1 hypothetical protein KO561_01445 [Radiobacillus kanasensis]